MTVVLKLKGPLDLPLEADTVTPSHFAGKKLEAIRELPVLQGNRTLPLKEFFDITGRTGKTVDETEVVVSGDLRKVKMIGKGMDGGRVTVEGNVGMYLGAEMISGRIVVNGSVDAWAAAEMQGGNIQINGNAGDYLCAGLRGSADGMTGGRVYVAGDVGREMASHMRKGFIAVRGNVGAMAAARMKGGSIVIVGNVAERLGVEATRGMIFVLGKIDSVLPTYRLSGRSEREFVSYYIRYLKSRRPDFVTEDISADEEWMKLVGDFAEGDPRQEVYVRTSKNEHILGILLK
jgi:formylmethanofuran dehydrogenase subunit C